jgi:hypothetical protein
MYDAVSMQMRNGIRQLSAGVQKNRRPQNIWAKNLDMIDTWPNKRKHKTLMLPVWARHGKAIYERDDARIHVNTCVAHIRSESKLIAIGGHGCSKNLDGDEPVVVVQRSCEPNGGETAVAKLVDDAIRFMALMTAAGGGVFASVAAAAAGTAFATEDVAKVDGVVTARDVIVDILDVIDARPPILSSRWGEFHDRTDVRLPRGRSVVRGAIDSATEGWDRLNYKA